MKRGASRLRGVTTARAAASRAFAVACAAAMPSRSPRASRTATVVLLTSSGQSVLGICG